MTFLLFLASLGLLHYVLGRADESAAASHEPPEREPVADAAPAATAGLLSLGRALEKHGRGRTPQPGEPGKIEEVAEVVMRPRTP